MTRSTWKSAAEEARRLMQMLIALAREEGAERLEYSNAVMGIACFVRAALACDALSSDAKAYARCWFDLAALTDPPSETADAFARFNLAVDRRQLGDEFLTSTWLAAVEDLRALLPVYLNAGTATRAEP